VYDHFGDLSITHWGEEVPCEEIQSAIMRTTEKKKDEDESTNE